MELTFNWLYADNRDIAQFTSGRLPLRPATVDPGLPTKGTGEHEWRGFAAAKAHAQVVSPASGLILNWNNKPARGYAASDADWTWGSVQRVDLLWAGIQRRQKHTLGSVVAAMNGASTQDLRVMRVWPVIRAVLARGTPPTARASAAATLLDAWLAARRQPDRRRPRREDRRGGRSRDGRSLGSARRRRPRLAARCGHLAGWLARRARKRRLARPAARRPRLQLLRRLVVVRGQGPQEPARPPRAGRLPDTVLRRRQRRRLRRLALGGARRRRGAARGSAGPEPGAWRADATKERIGSRRGS